MIRGSLQQRLVAVVFIAALPVFLAHLAIQVYSDVRTASERTTLITEDIAAAALPLLKSTLVVGDLATAQETLDNIMNNGEFMSIRLYGQTGRDLIADGRAERSPATVAVPAWFRNVTDFRFPARRFPVVAGGTTYGTLELEPSPVFLLADIWRRLWTASLVWLLTIALALWLLKAVLRRSLQPLENLAAAANRLGEGDLTCRATVSDVPELAATATAFNRMAERLVDAHKRLEERIEDTARELDSLITRIPAGVFKLRMFANGGMRFDYVSPQWCELLETKAAEVYADPDTPMSRIHPDDVAGFIQLNEHARRNKAPFAWEGRLRDGMRVRWMHVESIPSVLENGDTLWDGIQYDISTIKEHEARLDQIAHYDTLTGIPNRLLLTDRMKQAVAQAQRMGTTLAVCYLDLDEFKPVNDTFGHQAGDVLLIEIARRLKSAIRGGDTAARIGGDEFVLLLIGLERIDEYKTALDRILAAINEPVEIGPQRVSVSASIGIALYPADNSDPDLLLRHADQAMYRAKQAGRNKLRFFDRSIPD
jgi:diguanylate cyclase (GGDEF)-like protein